MNNIAANPPGLAVTDLSKHYPTPSGQLNVLQDINLRLQPGRSLAVCGVSGSGKSTLLNILGTLDTPSAGAVKLNGQDPFALKPAALAEFRRRSIGFVFQDHHLLPQLTALENLLLAPLAGRPVTPDDLARAESLLSQVGLADRAHHLPSQLSGGQRQRVALARALMNAPALLLADEPTGNLDHAAARQVAELLLDLTRRNQTILIVATHSEQLAGLLQQTLHLRDGALKESHE